VSRQVGARFYVHVQKFAARFICRASSTARMLLALDQRSNAALCRSSALCRHSFPHLAMWAYAYVCMCVCVYIRRYVCMHACMCVCRHVCVYVCMHVCMYIHICMRDMKTRAHTLTHACLMTVQHSGAGGRQSLTCGLLRVLGTVCTETYHLSMHTCRSMR
jgi:hypothetical protein